MGEPITSPNLDYGADCNSCTPARWAVGKTPASVWFHFSDITSCGRSPHSIPNGMLIRLDQNPASPCHYQTPGAGWVADWWPGRGGTNDSYIQLVDPTGWFWFVGRGAFCPAEHSSYDNDQFMCLFAWAAMGGTATVIWNTTVLALVEAFGLRAGSDLMLEILDAPTNDLVYKFCDRYQRSNIKFRVDH